MSWRPLAWIDCLGSPFIYYCLKPGVSVGTCPTRLVLIDHLAGCLFPVRPEAVLDTVRLQRRFECIKELIRVHPFYFSHVPRPLRHRRVSPTSIGQVGLLDFVWAGDALDPVYCDCPLSVDVVDWRIELFNYPSVWLFFCFVRHPLKSLSCPLICLPMSSRLQGSETARGQGNP